MPIPFGRSTSAPDPSGLPSHSTPTRSASHGAIASIHSSTSEPRFRYDRKGAARYLSISERSLDYLIAAGRLATLRDGKKVMILRAELEKYGRINHYESVVSVRQV